MNNKNITDPNLKKRAPLKFLALLLMFTAVLFSQNSAAKKLPPLNDAFLKQTITEIIAKIRSEYIIEAEGERIADAIKDHYQAGDYAGLDGPGLARKITEDLYAASNDLHMVINYDPDSIIAAANEEKQTDDMPNAAEMALQKERAKNDNFGYQDFKWLPEKVAVISITGSNSKEYAEKHIDSMMQLAEGANAIIFDVRSNGGGSPEGARYVQSYFLDEVLPMIEFRNRQEKQPFIDKTFAEVNGKKRVGLPMYVLIDGLCASACEDFAISSRDSGIATLVGETTAGAGYMNRFFPINNTFQLSVSIAGAFSAKTGDHFQTIGVSPDVEVVAPDALNKAYAMILAELASQSQDSNEQKRLKRRESWIQADLNRVDSSLSEYQGTYGKNIISSACRYLKLTTGHQSFYYKALGGDVFVEAIRGNHRIQFDRNETGNVIAYNLLSVYADMKTYPKE